MLAKLVALHKRVTRISVHVLLRMQKSRAVSGALCGSEFLRAQEHRC